MGIRTHQTLSTNNIVPDETNIEEKCSNNSPTDFKNLNNRALILHSLLTNLLTINLL